MRGKGLLVIIILLSILVVVGGMYYLQTRTTLNTQIPQPSANMTDWKQFISDKYDPIDRTSPFYQESKSQIKISVSYPPDWKEEFIDGKTPPYVNYSPRFTFSKGNYKIEIVPGAGPSQGCYFDEDTEYTEIESFTTLRRQKEWTEKGITYYEFCSPHIVPGEWSTPETDIGGIRYLVPENTSNNELAIMDKIISSIKIIK